ncbi:MAG: sugar ABC transporter substrate-binding protein [Patescibacteria group bacterium]
MRVDKQTIFQAPKPFSSTPSKPEASPNLQPPQPPIPPESQRRVPPPTSPPPQTPQGLSPSTPPSEPPVKRNFFSIRFLRLLVGLITTVFVIFLLFLIVSRFFGGKEKTVTLIYWGLWEDPNVVSQVISDFERQNPNIKIDYSKQDIKDYRERLSTRIKEGSGPDIFRFHNSWYPMLSEYLLPLPQSVITKDEFVKNYYPVTRYDLVKKGAIYGIPLHIDTLALYVNREMFEAAGLSPPKTWEEFRDVAYSLTVKDEEGNIKTTGAGLGTFENVSHAPDIISLLLIQNGVDVYKLSLDQRLYDTLDFYTSFAREGQSIWNSTLDNSLVAFSKGNLAMFFGYSWDLFTIRALNPDLAFEVIPVPQLDIDAPKNFSSYWAEGVSSESKHKKESFLFMEFLARKDTQEKLFTEASKVRPFGELYSDVSLADRLKDNEDVYAFLIQAPNAYSSYFVADTYDNGLNEKLNNYLKDAINFVLSGGSVESASETLIQGYNQVLETYENKKE